MSDILVVLAVSAPVAIVSVIAEGSGAGLAVLLGCTVAFLPWILWSTHRIE